jgi:hypothetical protein
MVLADIFVAVASIPRAENRAVVFAQSQAIAFPPCMGPSMKPFSGMICVKACVRA